MKLPEIQQIAFQGSAQTLAFDPVQIPDPNPRIQADLASIAKSFSNMEASGVQGYKRQEQQAKQMEKLYAFIPKAAQDIYKIQDEAREATAKAVAAEVLLNTDPEEVKKYLDEESASRRAQEQTLEDAAVKEARAGSKEPGNSEVNSMLLNYKGKQRKHIQIGLAKQLGVVLPEWVSEQRKNNSGMIYLSGLQKSVRINDKNLPPSVAEQVRQELMKSAMGIGDISGKGSMDLGILAEHGMPLIRNNMLQIKQREDRTWRSTNGHNQRMMLIRQWRDTLGQEMTPEERGKAYNTFITAMAATTPISGEDRGIGEAVAASEWEKSIDEAVLAGEQFDQESYGNMVVGPNGALLKDFYPGHYNRVKASVIEKQNREFSNRMGARQRSVKQQTLSYLQHIKENEGEITFEAGAAQVKFLTEQAQAAGLTPAQAGIDRIQGQLLMYGEGSSERQALIASAEADNMTGRLSLSHPLFATALGRTHPLYEVAKRNDANNLTEEHKGYKDVITDIVSANLGSAKNLYGELKGVGGQIVNAEYAKDLSNFNRDLEAAKTPEERRQVLASWTKKKTEELNKAFAAKSGNLLELDANKRPFRWFNQAAAVGTQTEQITNQLAHIVDVAKTGGNVYSELQNNPSSLVARDRALTDMGKLLSGQPIGDFYSVAAQQINAAAGKEIIKSPMDLLAAVYRSYEPNSFDAKQIEQAVRRRNELPAAQKTFFDRHLSGQYVNPNGAILSSGTQARAGFEGRVMPVAGVINSIPHPLNSQPGYTLPNITPLAGQTKAQLVNIPDDAFRWLAFGASGEAGPGDDIYGVAASIINRYAEGRGSFEAIVTNPTQYEHLQKGTAKFRPDIEAKFRSPEGRAKLVEALIKLQGRTDFKGRREYKNAGRTDVMFHERGNTFHHPEERAKTDVYSGPPKNAWRRFVTGI
jgi:hypothetical protein